MRVSHLALTDFRSYVSAVVEFPPGVTVLHGQNGRGKTNLIEAIAFIGTFHSHRAASSNNLVRISGEGDFSGGAVIRARVEDKDRSNLVELEIARGRANRARLNRAKVAPREILGSIRPVVFAPEDMELMKGDPSVRRSFLDDICIKLKPHHLGVLQDFQKVLKQRAALLKQLQKNEINDYSVLSIWDEQLAMLSANIVVHRLAVVEALKPHLSQVYSELTNEDRVAEIAYTSHLEKQFTPGRFCVNDGRFEGDATETVEELKTAFLLKIAEKRSVEIIRGINLVGAHRDDMVASLDKLPVKGFASHGETWSVALSLRLAEAEVLLQGDDYPILILDDVFAELDESRRKGLATRIKKAEQVLITAAVLDDIPTDLDAHVINVSRDENGFSQLEVLQNA